MGEIAPNTLFVFAMAVLEIGRIAEVAEKWSFS
jgi:hypothetical protein